MALTKRQMEVAELIAAGKTNQAIAAESGLSARTVETYIHNIIQAISPPDESQPRVYIALWYLRESGQLRPLRIGGVDRVVRIWEMPHPLESPEMAEGLMLMMMAA